MQWSAVFIWGCQDNHPSLRFPLGVQPPELYDCLSMWGPADFKITFFEAQQQQLVEGRICFCQHLPWPLHRIQLIDLLNIFGGCALSC